MTDVVLLEPTVVRALQSHDGGIVVANDHRTRKPRIVRELRDV